MPQTKAPSSSRWPLGAELPERPSDRSAQTPNRGLGFEWRRELPIFAAIVAVFALIYAGLQLMPYSFSSREPAAPAAETTTAFLRNPAFELTPAEAALMIGRGMRLGDLARIFKAASTNATARAFVDAFLANRPLRQALQRYLVDKDAKALARALARSPEFSRLLAEFMKNGDFQELLAGFASEQALQARSAAESLDGSSEGSIELTRSGDLLSTQAASTRERFSGPSSSWSGGLATAGRKLTGAGYDREPQPGEEMDDTEPTRAIAPVERRSDTGLTNAPITPPAPVPQPAPLPTSSDGGSSVGCGSLASYANTSKDASAPLQACINQTPPSGTMLIPKGSYSIAQPLIVNAPITIATEGSKPTDPPCTGDNCAVLEKKFNASSTSGSLFKTSDSTPMPINVDHVVSAGSNGDTNTNSTGVTIAYPGSPSTPSSPDTPASTPSDPSSPPAIPLPPPSPPAPPPSLPTGPS